MNPLDVRTQELVVDDIQSLTSEIKSFRLVRPDRTALAPFTAGSHIRVLVSPETSPQWRHYSLINFDVDSASTLSPDSYLVAVKQETNGKGGSRWMHEHLQPGDTVVVSEPINAFGLSVGDQPLLFAGGIGITPITAMAAALTSSGDSFELHYSGRSIAHMPFVEELTALAHRRLHIYSDDQPDQRLNLSSVLNQTEVGRPLYICGPKGMIDAVLSLALERGWQRDQIHVELFSEHQPSVGDSAFDVELRKSSLFLRVGPDQTILDVMLEAGLDPLYDCRRGECGICQTTVVEGRVEHRDYCLSEEEKRSGRVMQICVSRACEGQLVLDA